MSNPVRSSFKLILRIDSLLVFAHARDGTHVDATTTMTSAHVDNARAGSCADWQYFMSATPLPSIAQLKFV